MRSPAGRIAIVAGTVVALVVLFLVLRGRDGDEEAATKATTTTATATDETTSAPTTSSTPTTTTTAPVERTRVIQVSVRGGEVAGGVKTVQLEKNDRFRLIVRADVADHVHLHGYDVMRDVAPGKPAQFALRATLVGGFEVELEDRKLRILELEVRP